jgi:hypothetical protein
MPSRARTLACALAATLVLGVPNPASAVRLSLDTFVEPFPPHPQLPQTRSQILFHGLHCDGTCPPGAWVNHAFGDDVIQSGVPTVPGGSRAAVIHRKSGSSPAMAVIEDGRLRVVAEPGESLRVAIAWGVWHPLGLDVPASGCDRLELGVKVLDRTAEGVEIRGTIVFRSRSGESRFPLPLAGGGELSWDLARFPGVDFTRLDAVILELLLANTRPIEYEISPVGFATSVVSAQTESWGRVRLMYR